MKDRLASSSGAWIGAAAILLLAATAGLGQTDPGADDSDDDGVPDIIDVCPADPDPLQENSDLISVNSLGQPSIRLFCPNQREGNNTCPSQSPIATGRSPFAVAAEDFDRDGCPDVAVATREQVDLNGDGQRRESRVWVHFSNCNLKDGVKINPLGPIFRGSMGLEDFDGDGQQDRLCSGTQQDECQTDADCGGAPGSCVLVEDIPVCVGTTRVCASDADCGGGAGSCASDDSFSRDDRENLGCVDGDDRTPCQVTFLPTDGDLRGIVASDFNNDDKADIATVSFNSAKVFVFLGNGNGTFSLRGTIGSGASPRDLISADFNGDSLEDLAVPNFGINRVTILLGTPPPDGFFKAGGAVSSGPNPISAAAADFNGDLKTDLAILNFGIPFVQDLQSITIALGDGEGRFPVLLDLVAAVREPFHVAAGQVNIKVDSLPDLVSVSLDHPNQALLTLGLGAGEFLAPGIGFTTQGQGSSPNPGPRFSALLDLTTDKIPDLAIANDTQGDMVFFVGGGTLPLTATSLFHEDASGQAFAPGANYNTAPLPGTSPSNGPRGFTVVDLDGNGGLDVVVANLNAIISSGTTSVTASGSLNVFTSAGDGVGDACDNCRFQSNSPELIDGTLKQRDTDNDQRGNACDVDDDDDLIPDPVEPTRCLGAGQEVQVCGEPCPQPLVCDPEAVLGSCLHPLCADRDQDCSADGSELIFFVTDPFRCDTDGDGIRDGLDLCPTTPNVPGQVILDTDCDRLGDICDFDDDNDDLTDAAEPGLGLDPLNPDTDGDAGGTGDPCDPGDADPSLFDGSDNCPTVPNPDQKDTDDDLLGDLCDPDIDNDGLTNLQELELGTREDLQDTDGDGLTDFEEVQLFPPTDPPTDTDGDSLPDGALDGDSDGDLADDGTEVNVLGTNPLVEDTDGDGLRDRFDNCPRDPNAIFPEDTNGNGELDPGACAGGGEICFADSDCTGDEPRCEGSEDLNGNRVLDQEDLDGDGVGDTCDLDRDGDGLLNIFESNPMFCTSDFPPRCLDPDDPDIDDDGLRDDVDILNGGVFSPDTDGDGIQDGDDNCVIVPNPLQEDSEGRGPDGICAETAGGGDGECATAANNNPALFGPDQACGTPDDLLPTPEGADGECGTADDSVLFYGPDEQCGTVDDIWPTADGRDATCYTEDDNASLYGTDGVCGDAAGSDGVCGTLDDNPELYGTDGLCGVGPEGPDGACYTEDDNISLYGQDGKCGGARGSDGICGTADDNPTLNGPDGVCGTPDDALKDDLADDDGDSDDQRLGEGLNLDNDPVLFGPDGKCGTSDDLKGDGVGDVCEMQFGSSVARVDSDGDGLSDGAEVYELTDFLPLEVTGDSIPSVATLTPGESDGDFDGLCDSFEIEGATTAVWDDTDLDGFLDGGAPLPAGTRASGPDGRCDDDLATPLVDERQDNITCLFGRDSICGTDDDLHCFTSTCPLAPFQASGDNCPLIFNPDQADLDRDRIGDLCDDDLDGDGLTNDFERKVARLNERLADTDMDGRSDFEELFVTGSNPRVADTDFDGVRDGLDNCPINANPGQGDLDGDKLGDACDCAPFDGSLQSPPGEVRSLTARFPTVSAAAANRMALAWLAPAGPASAALRYDVARGRISDLRATRSFEEAICLADSLEARGTIDGADPGPGQVFYYLVRAENTCGGGTYGVSSEEARRDLNGCPD